jgi:hypothetical protein
MKLNEFKYGVRFLFKCDKIIMVIQMEKNNISVEKAREFCKEVRILAQEYNLPFFIVTDGASATDNNGCEAVRNARLCHINWEKSKGFDPNEDWGIKRNKDLE